MAAGGPWLRRLKAGPSASSAAAALFLWRRGPPGRRLRVVVLGLLLPVLVIVRPSSCSTAAVLAGFGWGAARARRVRTPTRGSSCSRHALIRRRASRALEELLDRRRVPFRRLISWLQAVPGRFGFVAMNFTSTVSGHSRGSRRPGTVVRRRRRRRFPGCGCGPRGSVRAAAAASSTSIAGDLDRRLDLVQHHRSSWSPTKAPAVYWTWKSPARLALVVEEVRSSAADSQPVTLPSCRPGRPLPNEENGRAAEGWPSVFQASIMPWSAGVSGAGATGGATAAAGTGGATKGAATSGGGAWKSGAGGATAARPSSAARRAWRPAPRSARCWGGSRAARVRVHGVREGLCARAAGARGFYRRREFRLLSRDAVIRGARSRRSRRPRRSSGNS